MNSGATFDATGAYRYALWRVWDEDLPHMAFIMLNPSTADAERNDPTIRRCTGFARAWGFGGVHVVNLFAYRTPSPAVLRKAADAIGPENDTHIWEAAQGVAFVVAAWGNHGVVGGRDASVRSLLSSLGITPRCLGITRAGQPRHPLYARGDTLPLSFDRSHDDRDPSPQMDVRNYGPSAKCPANAQRGRVIAFPVRRTVGGEAVYSSARPSAGTDVDMRGQVTPVKEPASCA